MEDPSDLEKLVLKSLEDGLQEATITLPIEIRDGAY
jgi:hypothetical protein